MRFTEVGNPSRMEGDLITIWFGRLRFKVNIPKFGREKALKTCTLKLVEDKEAG